LISHKFSNPQKQERKQLLQAKTGEKNGEGGGVFKHPKTPTPFAPYSTLKR